MTAGPVAGPGITSFPKAASTLRTLESNAKDTRLVDTDPRLTIVLVLSFGFGLAFGNCIEPISNSMRDGAQHVSQSPLLCTVTSGDASEPAIETLQISWGAAAGM